MANETNNAEKKVFIISSIGTVITSTIGFIVFFISSSQAVLLDSLFSMFNALLTIISIWVVTVTSEKPSEDYPYGLTQARPMLELFKAIVLLSFIIIAIFNSISSIIDGGSNLPGDIIGYCQ
ncbi:MAG: cation transporter [Streptococcus suis]